jgi:hypothetical protein
VTDGENTSVEVVNLLLGRGNDTLLIEGTLNTDAIHGGVTTVHGGGNRTANDGDTIVVEGGGGAESLLVIYGDTSQDGVWYSGDPGVPNDGGVFGPKPFDKLAAPDEDEVFDFPLANRFQIHGKDVIVAYAEFQGPLTFAGNGAAADSISLAPDDPRDFRSLGFLPGREIIVDSPTGQNTGAFRIAGLSADGRTLFIDTDGLLVDETGVPATMTAGADARMLTIYGGRNDDLIIGSREGDHIGGGSGNDLVFGQGGIDH